MKKRWIGAFLAAVMTAAAITGCGGSTAAPAAEDAAETEDVSQAEEESAEDAAEAGTVGESAENTEEPAEIQVFIAASLNTVMQEVAAKYNETHPDVSIVFNADSSGKLLTQIEEGYTWHLRTGPSLWENIQGRLS